MAPFYAGWTERPAETRRTERTRGACLAGCARVAIQTSRAERTLMTNGACGAGVAARTSRTIVTDGTLCASVTL